MLNAMTTEAATNAVIAMATVTGGTVEIVVIAETVETAATITAETA